MGLYALVRFLLPNAGVSVSEAGTDLSTTAALGLAVQNLDTHAANKDTTNNFTALQEFSAGISADGATTLTLPAATDTLVGKATIDTLTNKTLTGPKADVIKDTSGNTVATITAGGGVQIGSPTGGDKGSGTLNATNLYINGMAIATSGNPVLLSVSMNSAADIHTTPQFVGPGGTNATESFAATPMTQAVTLTKLYLQLTTAAGTTTATLRKNNAATTITCNAVGVAAANDTAHSVAFAAGDTWDGNVTSTSTATTSANLQLGT